MYKFWQVDPSASIKFLTAYPRFYFVEIPKTKERTFEELVQLKGFKSEAEFHSLVSKVDLATHQKLSAFRHWQSFDGSKAGLLAL